MLYKLFIYYQVYVLIYSTTTVLLAFERVGFERDSQKMNYILLNLFTYVDSFSRLKKCHKKSNTFP